MFLTRVFLLGWITPPARRSLLHHDSSNFVGSFSSDLRVTFPMKVICRLATWFLIIVMSKNIQRIILFVILSSFASVVVTPSILMMLRWRKNSISPRSETRRAHISHPHSKIFMGMTSNINYLLQRSTYVSFQKWCNAPIDEEAEAVIISTSYLLQILYDTNLPRYLKCFLNVTNPSETVMLFIPFDYSYALSYFCLFFSRFLSCKVW